MTEQSPTTPTYLAINDTDASGIAHVVAFKNDTITYGQWTDALDRLTGEDEEPFGFRGEVGIAAGVRDPISALNLIDRACFFLTDGEAGEEGQRMPEAAYSGSEPVVHVLVTLPIHAHTLDVHTDTILQLLRLGGSAVFAFAPNHAPGLRELPHDCVHLSISYLDRFRRDQVLVVCAGDAGNSATAATAADFAVRSISDHLVFLSIGADFLRMQMAD